MSFLRLLPQRLPQFVRYLRISPSKFEQACNYYYQKYSRQVERDVETVINVLQPGPIGILEHKFTDAEIREAQTTVRSAVENWRQNRTLERNLDTGSFDRSK